MEEVRVMIARDKYLNFPIQMLEGFMIDTEYCLFQILGYAIYDTVYSENAIYDSCDEFWEKTEIWADSLHKREQELLVAGESWYNRISRLEKNPPFVGIRTDLFLDFYEHESSEFEKICLLAFLAMRSIIGKASYKRMTVRYLICRMSGFPGIEVDMADPPEEIIHWMGSESKRKRIYSNLKKRYKMIKAYKANGIICSFKLSQTELEKVLRENRDKRIKSNKSKERIAWEQAQKQFEAKNPDK
mgnify:CR=1 FL=1